MALLTNTPILKSLTAHAAGMRQPTERGGDGVALKPVSTAPVMDLGANANLGGTRVLANSAWYSDVSNLPIHPDSGKYLATLGSQVYSQDAGGWMYDGKTIGLPYFVVDSTSQPFVPVVCAQYFDSSDLSYAPIPLRDDIIEGYPGNALYPLSPDAGSDRHLIVIDRYKRVIYELYKAYRREDHWYCSNMAIWDMDDGDLQRPFNDTSVDVAGLSVMAGLLLGHQVVNNTIDHAIRFTIQHQCPYFLSPPAAHASAYGNVEALPFGGRLRLKARLSEAVAPDGKPWNENALRVVRALKRYGMINADTGLALSSQGDSSKWDAANGTGGPAWQQLRGLRTSDFEVVKTAATQYTAYRDRPSGTQPAATLQASASEVAAGQSVILTPSWSGKSLAWLTPVGHVVKSAAPVTHTPTRDSWYMLEVVNPYGRVRRIKRVIVSNGVHRYATYDRYIGPTGSLANDGLTPSKPWPIAVLNAASHRHLVAGFIIGVLDGTYNLSGMTAVEYDYPLLQIPTGTFGRPTVLQAVNRRQPLIAGGSASSAVLGSRYQGLSQIQLIGLRLDAAAAPYATYFSGDGAFLVDDCEFSGFKLAAIRATGVSAPLLRGNRVHNTSASWFMRLDGCTDVHARGSVLDVSARVWDEYGAANTGVVVD